MKDKAENAGLKLSTDSQAYAAPNVAFPSEFRACFSSPQKQNIKHHACVAAGIHSFEQLPFAGNPPHQRKAFARPPKWPTGTLTAE